MIKSKKKKRRKATLDELSLKVDLALPLLHTQKQ